MDGSASADTRVEILESLGIDVAKVDLADDEAAIDALWEGTMRQIGAQLRFMGRLAGIDDSGAHNPDAPEVKQTREMVVEAFRDFFVVDVRAALDEIEADANARREAMLEKYPPETHRYIDQIYPTQLEFGSGAPPTFSTDHPVFDRTGDGRGIDYVDGLASEPADLIGVSASPTNIEEFEAGQALRDEFISDLRGLAETIRDRQQFDEALFEQQMANIINIFRSAWEALKTEYERITSLIEEGRYMFAVNYVGSVAAQALPGAILTFVALALVGAAGGGVVLAVSRNVFQIVVRQAITIAPVRRQMRNVFAGALMSVTITRMRRSAMPGGFEDAGQIGRTVDIDTNKLPAEEARMVRTTEGTIGSTEADSPLDESLPGDGRRTSGRDRGEFLEMTPSERERLGAPPGVQGRYANDPPGVYRWNNGDAAIVHPDTGKWTVPQGLGKHRGSFGEYVGTSDLERSGNTPLLPRKGLGDPTNESGIDQIFTNNSPPPPILVVESKYRSGEPFKVEDFPTSSNGTQMDTPWINGHADDLLSSGQIDRATHRSIMNGDYTPVLQRIGPDGKVQNIDLETGKDLDTGEQVLTPQQLETWRE